MNTNAFIIAFLGAASVLLIVLGLRRRRSTLIDLLSEYERLDDIGGDLKTRRGLEDLIMAKVIAAGMPLRPREVLGSWAALSAVCTAVFLLSAKNPLLAMMTGVAVASGIGWMLINIRAVRRLRKFEDQLTRALTTLGNLLESGRSLPQALDTVAQQTPAPLGPELIWVTRQYAVGIELPDALIAVSKRVNSEEFRFFATAVDMNRTAGADLVGVLKSLVATLAERLSLRGELRSRLAEVQLTKYVVGAAPAVAGVSITLASPEQMRPLFNSTKGVMMLIISIVLWAVGMAITNMMVRKVEP